MTPADHHRREVSRIARSAAVARVVRAVEVPGVSPPVHRDELAGLRRRWPALAGALAELMREQGRAVPPEWRGLP